MGTEDLIIRVSAYYGEPKLVGTVPTRSGVILDTPVDKDYVDNELRDFESMTEVVDHGTVGGVSDYTLDRLVADVQNAFKCKVNIELEPTRSAGKSVYTFDVFEPGYAQRQDAEAIVKELSSRIEAWVRGW